MALRPVNELLEAVRARAPQLADMDDSTLTEEILARRPEAAQQFDFGQTQPIGATGGFDFRTAQEGIRPRPFAEFASQARNDFTGNIPELAQLDDVSVVERMIQEDPRFIREFETQGFVQEQIKKEQQRGFAEAPLYERFLAGAGKGIMDIVQGGKQLVGLGDPDYEAESQVFEQAAEGDIPSLLGEITGSIAATAVPGTGGLGAIKTLTKVPKLLKVAKVAAKAPKIVKAAKIAGAGAAAGSVEFTGEEESRAKNMVFGALFASGGALVGKVGAKAFNAFKGKMKNANLQELVDLAKKHDVPLSFGDVSQSPTAKKLEAILEDVPIVGTTGFRRKGIKKATKAIETFEDKTRKGIQGVGEDIQFSLTTKSKKVKRKAAELYDKVEELSTDETIDPKSMKRAVNKILDDIEKSDVPSGVKQFYDKIKTKVERGDKTYSSLRATRSDLGNEIRKNQINDPNAARLAKTLKDAVEKDMEKLITKKIDVGTFATPSKGRGLALKGEKELIPIAEVGKAADKTVTAVIKNTRLKEAFEKANKFYREKVVPITKKSLVKAQLSDEPDQIMKGFIKAGQGDKAKNFFNALDESGRGAVRYGMVRDAVDKAFDESKKTISPGTFAGHLEKMKDARKVFFTGDAGKEIDGIVKLMRHAERHGRVGEVVPTGVRVVQAAGLAGTAGLGFFNPALLAKVGGAAFATKTLLTSKAGRNFLLAASKIEPDSPKMQKLLERINRYLGPRAAASGGVGATN